MSRQRKPDGEISYNTQLQRNWTPEQREANRLYQREYREKNKQLYAKAQLKYALRILAEVQEAQGESYGKGE